MLDTVVYLLHIDKYKCVFFLYCNIAPTCIKKILFVSVSKNWKNGHPNYLSYFTNVLFYILFIICVNTAFPVFVEKLNLLLLFFFGCKSTANSACIKYI